MRRSTRPQSCDATSASPLPPPPPPHQQRRRVSSAMATAAAASGLPQRGAFSSHLLLDSPGSLRSASLPPPLSPSAPSSPRSGGYEYSPVAVVVERAPAKPPSSPSRRVSAPSRIPLSSQPHAWPHVRSSAAVAPLQRTSAVGSTAVAPAPSSPPSLGRAIKRGSVSCSVLGVDAPAASGIRGTSSLAFHHDDTQSFQDSPASGRTPSTGDAAVALSVHPIETLAKKLRQQAQELTSVYEQLERKTQEVADRDAQLLALRLQLEKLRGAKRVLSAATAGSSAKRQSAGTAKTLAGVAGGGAAPAAKTKAALTSEVETLQRQVVELERERSRFESATTRVKDAIAALTQRQAGARDSADGDGDDDDAAPSEQQLYIRVLEAAVHLKAFELRVTGHEELLVVLAELRHTIYQQERDVADKQQQLAALEQQHCEQTARHLALEQQLDAKATRRELELHELRQERAALAAQLAQAQRQLEKEREQRQRLQTTADESHEWLARLNEQLTSAAQLKTLAETKSETLARSLDELRGAAERATSSCEREQLDARRLREDAGRTQAQLEEAKALQDELLRSVDSYASAAEAAARESARLHGQLAAVRDEARSSREALESAAAEHASDAAKTQAALETTRLQLSEAQSQLDGAAQRVAVLERQAAAAIAEQTAAFEAQERKLAASEQQRGAIHESLQELGAGLEAAAALVRQQTEGEQLAQCARALDQLLQPEPSAWSTHLPPLRGFLCQVRDATAAAVDELDELRASWGRERADLHGACDELHAAARLCREEMRQAHGALVRAQTRLAEESRELAASRLETAQLRCTSEELAQERETLRALEQQAATQQQVIETQGGRLEAAARELQRAEASERTLAAALEEQTEQLRAATSERSELQQRTQRLALVEDALERAVALAERQHRQLQRLREKLAALERLRAEQHERLEALRAQEQAVAERVRSLFRRAVESLRAHGPSGGSAGARERFETFECEAQRGDVARLAQLLPALLEDVVAAESGARPTGLVSAAVSASSASASKSDNQRPAATPRKTLTKPLDGVAAADAACFQEQLALIREAFAAFR